MKSAAYLLCISLVLPFSVLAQAPDLKSMDIVERHTPDGPVAIIEDSPVSKESFIQLYKARIQSMSKQFDKVNDAMRIKTAYQSIGDLVRREILFVEGVKKGFKISDAEAEKRLSESMKAQQESAKQAGIKPISTEELIAESGKSKAELLESVKKSMIIEKMQNQLMSADADSITSEDVKKFYDSRPELFKKAGGFHLMQIFIQPKPSATEATEEQWDKTKKEVEKALARIKTGESFESVAKDVSESKDRNNGGDMGTVSDNELPDFVVTSVLALDNGELSDVVKSNYGYHIFKLLSTEKAEIISLSKATPKIREALLEAQSVNTIEAFALDAMQDSEKVKIFLKLEKAIAKLSPEELKMLAPDKSAN